MRGVLIVLAILVLAGCAGTEEKATPTPTPTATQMPTAAATPTPTPEPTPLPETHECFVVTDQGLQNAIAIQQCFMAKQEYVECVYFMTKEARIAEETDQTLVAGWALRLYSKSVDCAKEAEKLPNADLLPDQMSSKILNYFDCYQSDAVCGTTREDIDEIVSELSEVREEFL